MCNISEDNGEEAYAKIGLHDIAYTVYFSFAFTFLS